MEVNIYINGERLDSDAKTVIAETKQVNDFFDVKDRQTSYTNTFKIPKTERNIMLLGGMGIVGNTSIAPYQVHDVKVERYGIETISGGIGYFKPTNKYFNMFVYDNNINLFNSLGDKTLADLNLTFLNHNLNINTWLNSFYRSDYVYAVADYGKQDSSSIEIDFQAPSLFTNFLWNKIFSENNFSFKYVGRANQNDYNPFISDKWKETVITLDEGLPQNESFADPIEKLKLYAEKQVQQVGNFKTFISHWGQSIITQQLPSPYIEHVRFQNILNEDNIHVLSNLSTDNRSRIIIREDGFYQLKITGNFYNTATKFATMYVESRNTRLFTINEEFPEGRTQIGFDQKIYLKRGEQIYVDIETEPQENENSFSYDLNLDLILDNAVNVVNFSSFLSSIKQKDFIKDMMNQYGLMSRKNENVYEFIAYEELLNPLARYRNQTAVTENDILEDWSSKFHSIEEQDSKIGAYARVNNFKYKYDNEGDSFADGFLPVADQTINDTKTLISRPYKAPDNSVNSINGIRLKNCNLYKKEFNDDGTLKSVKPLKSAPYYARVKQINTELTYNIAGATGVKKITRSTPFLTFDGLDYNSIIPSYYAAFGNMINYGEKLKIKVYLSVLDIHALNFFKLKYFKQLGALYYLSKSIKFVKNGITTIEVIRVKSIEQSGQFNNDFNKDFNK